MSQLLKNRSATVNSFSLQKFHSSLRLYDWLSDIDSRWRFSVSPLPSGSMHSLSESLGSIYISKHLVLLGLNCSVSYVLLFTFFQIVNNPLTVKMTTYFFCLCWWIGNMHRLFPTLFVSPFSWSLSQEESRVQRSFWVASVSCVIHANKPQFVPSSPYTNMDYCFSLNFPIYISFQGKVLLIKSPEKFSLYNF